VNQGVAILGTGSDVGKSAVCSAILRILNDRGIVAAPYKAQNMSNNSAVTSAGFEIGRAQYTQALAARLEPTALMNPVLIKPQGDQSSQLVVMGQPDGTLQGAQFFKRYAYLSKVAWAAYDQLKLEYGCVVAEGAGSLAEVNLRDRDFANLGLAQEKKLPVILVADIDRGGVFAQIVGSLEVISPEDRALVKGIVINRFRGNPTLFESGVQWIEERTDLPVLGVLPFVEGLRLPAEDSYGLGMQTRTGVPKGPAVAVIQFPHISNFTDIEPFFQVPGLETHFLTVPQSLEDYQLVILPGSKSVISDLEWLRKTGWVSQIDAFRTSGGSLLGICGGYQMLGQQINDPLEVESELTVGLGLGILPMTTEMRAKKNLSRQTVDWHGQTAEGYEIHHGESRLDEYATTWLETEYGPEGCIGERVWGSYFHGLFDQPEFLAKFLYESMYFFWTPEIQEDPFDHFVAAVKPFLDVERLLQIMEVDDPK